MTEIEINAAQAKLCAAISRGHCPDCDYRGFVIGPIGGRSINIECGGCRNRFNVAFYAGEAVFAHRIESDIQWPVR